MNALSQELSAMAAELISRRAGLSAADVESKGRILAKLSELAFAQERELEIHRLREASRLGQAVLHELVDDHAAKILTDVAGEKVVRPDFGKGGRS